MGSEGGHINCKSMNKNQANNHKRQKFVFFVVEFQFLNLLLFYAMPSYPAKNILCFPIFLPRKRRRKVSYVFEPNVEIGDIPAGGRFPFRTVMQFDYGFLRGDD